jgi:predicted ribosome quality control (RQC) complex YloA/Tae2 family protein
MTALDEAGEVRLLADTLLECGAELWPRRQQTGFSQLTSRIQKRIRRQQKKVDRKVRAIQADMDRVKECEPLRHEAHLMIANLGAIRPGQTHLLAEDWQQEPPRPVRIELRPELSAQVQAERRFARARKLERGHRLAEHRLRLAEEEMRSLEAAARLVLEVRDAEDLASIIPSLLAAGIREPLGESTPKSRTERTSRQSRKPYRAYRSGDGLLILVGRGGADNDRVTLDHARPHDHWLHARGTPGAHVVIRLTKNQSCPPESLLDAATLAGHFSKLCDEAVVDIQHTSRRHIRKPKGAAAGSVTVEREKVLACRMEPSRIRRLLATEETGV